MTYTFLLHPDMVEDIAQYLVECDVIVQGEIGSYDSTVDALNLYAHGAKPKPVSQSQPHDWYRRYDKRPKK